MTYQVESWLTIWPDLPPLWALHQQELHLTEIMPARIDAQRYGALDAAGGLAIFTVRSAGRLAGYHIAVVDRHLNFCDILCAFVTLYWLHPRYRGQGIGGQMLRQAIADLKQRRVQLVVSATKAHLPYSPVFGHLGWRENEMQYTLWLGD